MNTAIIIDSIMTLLLFNSLIVIEIENKKSIPLVTYQCDMQVHT